MKQAQIKMFETMGVLVVFFFLLVAAASFYFQIQKSSIQRELDQQHQLRAIQIVQRAMYLPELDCSFVSVQKSNCFDLLKLSVLGSHLGISPEEGYLVDYYNMFGFSSIAVTKLYPSVENPVVLYKNIPDKYRAKVSTQSPVLLYDPFGNKYDFGVIEVEVYAE